MKRMTIILLFLCMAFFGLTVYAAEPEATISFSVEAYPTGFDNRAITVVVSTGPSDPAGQMLTLSALNQYQATVRVKPGRYYCNAAVQYDPMGEYQVVEENGLQELSVGAGEAHELHYAVTAESWYESVTGHSRSYQAAELETPPDGYDTQRQAQISVYLTAPKGYAQRTIIYLQNLYTGQVYELNVYAENGLAAVCTEATAGKYRFVGAQVAGEQERYSFSCEAEDATTEDGVNLHITVVDNEHPDRELVTISGPKLEQSDPVPPPTATPEPQAAEGGKDGGNRRRRLFSLWDLVPAFLLGAAALMSVRRLRR